MNKKFLLAIAASTLMFAACGDDVTEVTEVNEIHQEGIAVLDAGLELSKQKCGAENAGEMLFVTDSAMVFVCDGGTWVSLKGADGKPGEDGESCTAKPVTNEAGVEGLEVTCGKTVVGTIWSGVDGDDGESCTAKPVKNGAGVEGLEVTCGKTVVGTIWNGHDGAGCTLDDDGKGSVTVTCGEDEPMTLYKAMCAMEPYDPKTQFCDTRDDQLYKIVTIGTQTWMAQNLNYDPGDMSGSYAWSGCYGEDGYDDVSGSNLSDEEVAANCAKYGRLYTWEVTMNDANCGDGKTCSPSGTIRGVCPEGWHLPSHGEFETLINYIDPNFGYDHTGDASSSTAGYPLKASSGWNDGGNGSDSLGFSALPAGYSSANNKNFHSVGYFANFWSSTEYSSSSAYYLYLIYNYDDAYLGWDSKLIGRSVRCLKN